MALSRRGFIAGLFAAPAIVHIDNLMPIKTPKKLYLTALDGSKVYFEMVHVQVTAKTRILKAEYKLVYDEALQHVVSLPVTTWKEVIGDIASIPVEHTSLRTRHST